MKASAILIAPTVQLHRLPDPERDVLRRFFTEHVRGMDRKHDRRWRRFVKDLFNAAPGEGFQIYRAEERGGPFHRRHRVILQRLFDSQERYTNVDAMHDALKLRCYFVTWEEGKTGRPIPKPRSTAFDECSEDEIRELHTAMVDLLQTPHIQRLLWPHLKFPQRAEMVEAVLRNPDEGDQP